LAGDTTAGAADPADPEGRARSVSDWIEHRPEPAQAWIRFAPAAWPDAGDPWLDLAAGGLGSLLPVREDLDGVDGPSAPDADDVTWLPPVAERHFEARDELAARIRGRGGIAWVQILAGQPAPATADLVLIDLLAHVASRRRTGRAGEMPGHANAWILWPLLAGLSNDVARFASACDAWRDAGVRGVLLPAPRLKPVERRILARGREDLFDALFHGGAIEEGAFVHAAGERGLAVWLERPASGHGAVARRRAAAGVLSEIAELWARLGESPRKSESFFRAAREVEAAPWDLAALAREKNLGVLLRRDPAALAVLTEWLETGVSSLRADLFERYVGAGVAR
jgi:hypothetical protein